MPTHNHPDPVEKRFRDFVERRHVGVAFLGPEARVQFANQTALEFTGLAPRPALGKNTEEIGMRIIREDGT
ncbi:MAG: PAS domain S-box protein [Acidobacteriota bacterium]|nr:PAS domain S-box protein [Acidobacteriota bacterium]